MEILTLGEKIKQKRKELNMTLKDLAGEKVTPGQISLVESGKSKPSIDLLEYVAEKLSVTIDYILETEEHQAERLCEYYSKIAEASLLAENYEQAREAINKGAAYAKQYNLRFFMGLNDFFMGKIEFGHGNFEAAQSMFISSNEIFLMTGKIRNVIETYLYLGMVAYKLSYYNSSLNFYRQSEKLINEHKIVDIDMLMNIYYNISLCYSKLGSHSSTIDYLLLSLEKYKQKNDKYQYGQSLLMLSISYKSINKFEEALLYANRAIEIFSELDNMAFIATVETNMGAILTEIGNVEDSFKHLENAYKIKLETGDKTLIYTMLKLADNYIKTGDFDKALDIINGAYIKSNEGDFTEYRASIYYYYNKIYTLKGCNENAELNLIEAAKYFQNMNMQGELADIYIMMGEHYENLDRMSEALEFMNKGIKIYKEQGIIFNENKRK